MTSGRHRADVPPTSGRNEREGRVKVSLIQMNATDDKAADLARAESLIAVPAGTVGQRAG